MRALNKSLRGRDGGLTVKLSSPTMLVLSQLFLCILMGKPSEVTRK